jgi:hypothetical protein
MRRLGQLCRAGLGPAQADPARLRRRAVTVTAEAATRPVGAAPGHPEHPVRFGLGLSETRLLYAPYRRDCAPLARVPSVSERVGQADVRPPKTQRPEGQDRSNLIPMSSDSFADLGGALRKVADGLIRLVDLNKRPAAGSLADKEADGEPFAGEWSAHPGRDLIATLLMECWSCADHLTVTGAVLTEHRGCVNLIWPHLLL